MNKWIRCRHSLIILGFHLFTGITAIILAFWAERKWQIIDRNEVELGVMVRPVQYLVEWKYLFSFIMFFGLGSVDILRKDPVKAGITWGVVDIIFMFLCGWFLIKLAMLNLPLLPWSDRIDYILDKYRSVF